MKIPRKIRTEKIRKRKNVVRKISVRCYVALLSLRALTSVISHVVLIHRISEMAEGRCPLHYKERAQENKAVVYLYK